MKEKHYSLEILKSGGENLRPEDFRDGTSRSIAFDKGKEIEFFHFENYKKITPNRLWKRIFYNQ